MFKAQQTVALVLLLLPLASAFFWRTPYAPYRLGQATANPAAAIKSCVPEASSIVVTSTIVGTAFSKIIMLEKVLEKTPELLLVTATRLLPSTIVHSTTVTEFARPNLVTTTVLVHSPSFVTTEELFTDVVFRTAVTTTTSVSRCDCVTVPVTVTTLETIYHTRTTYHTRVTPTFATQVVTTTSIDTVTETRVVSSFITSTYMKRWSTQITIISTSFQMIPTQVVQPIYQTETIYDCSGGKFGSFFSVLKNKDKKWF